MKVKWEEHFNLPAHPDDYPIPDDFVWPKPVIHRGEVIGSVRTWGETKLIVACDDGNVREVAATQCKAET